MFQVMLDDHILKAQTMHSSAYIKPFEEEMKEWEDKLISMQVTLVMALKKAKTILFRTSWTRGCDARNRGFILSPSSTARTS